MKRSAVATMLGTAVLLTVLAATSLAAPGTSVTNVTATPSTNLANHLAHYTISFTTSGSGALSTGDTITLKFPSGTLLGSSCGDVGAFAGNVTVEGVATSASSIVKCLELRVTVPIVPGGIGNNDSVTVVVGPGTDVVRNPGSGSNYRIRVRTTRDARDANSGKYTIVAQHAPVAIAQATATNEDVAKPITLMGSDLDGDALSFSISSIPAHGSLSVVTLTGPTSADVTYTPTGNYNGPDSFDFRVYDGVVSSAAATVSITVDPLNDAPVAINDDATVDEASVGNVIDVLANDGDVDGDALTITANTAASDGTASCGASSCTYTPNGGFSGDDSFTYDISDGHSGTDTAIVHVEVLPEPPGGGGGSVTIDLCAKANGSWDLGPANVPIWGFALMTGPDCLDEVAGLPGPTLDVDVGDTVTINLHNEVAGQSVALELVAMDLFPDPSGAPNGGMVSYTFTASEPGTFIYGAADNRQTLMGLYGALIVRPTTAGRAYETSASEFNVEAVLVLSEVDPDFNAAPTTFDLLDYAPTYWLINGEAYPDTDAIAASAGDEVLLRYVNAGAIHHTMSLLGTHQKVVGRDADPVRYPFEVIAETMPAGATLDAIATPATAGTYWLYNSQFHLDSAGTFPGGMLTRIVAS